MLKISAQSLWKRRRRAFGITSAVFLGVAFLVGTLVLGDTFSTNFDRLFTETAAGTDVVVRNATSVSDEPDAPRGLLDESIIDEISSVDGVAIAEAEVTGYGQLLDSDGDPIGGNGPPRIAGSWVENPDLNPYELVEGRTPEADDEVVVARGTAKTGDLALGDQTVVQTPRPIEVTIVGIATFGDEDGFGETTYTAFALDSAQRQVIGDENRISNVLIQADDGVGAGELSDRIGEVLPDGAEAITGDELVDERLEALGFLTLVRAFLVGFAVVALFVATLSISNTFTITVAQRTRELAMLRSIGASRRQVRRMVTAEALMIGGVASVAGAVGGLGVAVLLKGVFSAFGSGIPDGGMDIRPTSIIIGVAVGVVTTVLAARAPARRAAKIAPVEALRDTQAETAGVSRRRVVTGTVVTAIGVVASAIGAAGTTMMSIVGAIGIVAGALVLAPVLLPAVAQAMGAVLTRLRGVNGALATQNARRQPRRTAGAATALFIGVAVVSVFTVFAASASDRIDGEVSDGFGNADLSINTPAFGGGVLDTGIVDELDDVDEVERVAAIGNEPVLVDGDSTTATTTDPQTLDSVMGINVVDGALPSSDAGAAGSGDAGEAVIDETRADDEGWGVGSSFEVTFVDGSTVPMTVAAVVEDNEILSGIVVGEATWVEHVPQPAYTSVFITLADGVDTEAGRAAISGLADQYSGEVQDRAEFAESRTEGLDMLLGIVYVMLALAIIIALLGIANTLSLAVHERRHEIGLLRAVGQTRRQVRSVLRLESVVVSTFGTLLGMVVGSVCGGLMFVAVFDGGGVVLPAVQLVVIAVLGVVAGVLAAWRPARRASRLAVLDAIAAPQ